MILNTNLIDYILLNYDQEELYAQALNVDIEDIKDAIDGNYNILNTLRNDTKPSLKLSYSENKLKMWDFGSPLFRGDIFDLYGIILQKSVYNPSEFVDICNHIIRTFKTTKVETKPTYVKTSSVIHYEERPFNSFDVAYWKLGNVTTRHLKNRGVVGASRVHINNMLYAIHDNKDPIYIYKSGYDKQIELVKVYKPYADKTNKFRTNNKLPLEGLHDLYSSDVLIITKSKKDKLVLESVLDNGVIEHEVNNNILRLKLPPYMSYPYTIGLYSKTNAVNSSYCITNVTNEGILLTPHFVKYLKSKHNTIVINYDYDITGIFNAYMYYRLYDLTPVFIGRSSNVIIDSLTPPLLQLLSKKLEDFGYTYNEKEFISFIIQHEDEYKVKDCYEFVSSDNVKAKEILNGKFKVLKKK